MKRIVGVVGMALGVAMAWPMPARASDPIGGYALIDKVVLEPNAEAPTRVQVWGAFSFAKAAGGNAYESPVRGYLYYAIVAGKEDVCRKEWADLKKVAGSGEVIGMGSSYDRAALGSVRTAAEKVEKPDPYPLGTGLVRVRRDTKYAPIQNLVTLPAPVAPADGATVDPGKVTLSARNITGKAHEKAKYIFELESASGEKEASGAIDAGEKETKWSPRMPVKAGEKYTWRVRAIEGDWRGPQATATFQGKARP